MLACRAYWTALEGRPGAVHLNFPLREPLTTDEQLPADSTGRGDGRPHVRRVPAAVAGHSDAAVLGDLLSRARRGVVVAGRHERGTPVGRAAAAFAAAAGWPLLADPLSGARRGEAAIAHYDALLRVEQFADSLAPDVILRVGDLPVSKPLRMWLARLEGARQVAIDPDGAWQDPAAVLAESFSLDPAETLRELASACSRSGPRRLGCEEDWLSGWRSADERAAEAILGVLGERELSEPNVAAELGVLLPEEATLFVASSMPVRDVETFWPARPDPPRVLCNRGANGIDGTVSSAFGVAAGAAGPVVLLIGDVALAHDIGGLLAARRLALKLTIVLLDNGGGGIFDFLPVAQARMARALDPHAGGSVAAGAGGEPEDIYTQHVATPTGLDFAAAAALYGIAHVPVRQVQEFRGALERALGAYESSLIEVGGERTANVQLHRRVWDAVSGALSR